jgi:hypothetical protein
LAKLQKLQKAWEERTPRSICLAEAWESLSCNCMLGESLSCLKQSLNCKLLARRKLECAWFFVVSGEAWLSKAWD